MQRHPGDREHMAIGLARFYFHYIGSKALTQVIIDKVWHERAVKLGGERWELEIIRCRAICDCGISINLLHIWSIPVDENQQILRKINFLTPTQQNLQDSPSRETNPSAQERKSFTSLWITYAIIPPIQNRWCSSRRLCNGTKTFYSTVTKSLTRRRSTTESLLLLVWFEKYCSLFIILWKMHFAIGLQSALICGKKWKNMNELFLDVLVPFNGIKLLIVYDEKTYI